MFYDNGLTTMDELKDLYNDDDIILQKNIMDFGIKMMQAKTICKELKLLMKADKDGKNTVPKGKLPPQPDPEKVKEDEIVVPKK